MVKIDKCNKDFLDGTSGHANCVKEVENGYTEGKMKVKAGGKSRKVVRGGSERKRSGRRDFKKSRKTRKSNPKEAVARCNKIYKDDTP